MRKTVLVLAFGFLVLAGGGCEKEQVRVPCNGTNPTWNANVDVIVVTYCVSSNCHGTSGGDAADYTTYAKIKPFLDNSSFEKTVLERRTMPNDGRVLPDSVLGTLQCWLEDGFPEG